VQPYLLIYSHTWPYTDIWPYISLFGSVWEHLKGSVWLFRIAESLSYDIRTILHFADEVFLPLCLFLGQSLHHAIHVIKHVIVDSDDVMQSTGMLFRHPQGAIPEWPYNLYDILDNSPLILSCEEWPVITIFGVFKPLTCEFMQSVSTLEQLQC